MLNIADVITPKFRAACARANETLRLRSITPPPKIYMPPVEVTVQICSK